MMDDVSFVFQGSCLYNGSYEYVISNIVRVREIYPSSQIILSTWPLDSITNKIISNALNEIDVIVIFNTDPGSLIYRDGNYQWKTNINRMLLSSLNGVRRADRYYVVKLRTDSFLYNNNLKKILSKKYLIDRRFKRESEYSIFDERVINCNLFARDSRSYKPYLFHPGDIMLLGKKEDLLRLFGAPLAEESIFYPIFDFSIFSLMKYVPEQYFWIYCINKSKNRNNIFLGNGHNNKYSKFLSENYYINNFIAFDCNQLGFSWEKYNSKYNNKGKETIYDFTDSLKLNRIYKNKKNSNEYTFFFRTKVLIMKLFYFICYLPLRLRFLRRVVMDLKSRE